MATPSPDRILRQVLADLDATPHTVTAPFGPAAPVSPAAAAKLNARLSTVAELHNKKALTDAQFMAAIRGLVEACETTSVLQHMLTPEQIATERYSALEELTPEDLEELSQLSA